MPVVSAEQLRRVLAKGTRGGTWLLHGDEEYLKEAAARLLIDAHVDAATRDFNLDQLRGVSLDAEAFASICETPPLMADWRVVVLREAHAVAATARLRNAVEAVVRRPAPGLLLVLIAQFERGKVKFWEDVKALANSVEFPALPASDVPGWLVAHAAEDGIELDAAAARALASAVGSELGVLMQELQKLRQYAGDRRNITKADVAEVVGAVPRQNRWDWFDSVGEGRIADAREGLPTLLAGSESGVGLLIGLGTHMLRLGMAVYGGERALSEALPPYQRWLVSRLVRQARSWTPAAIDAALEDLLRADRLLKSTSLTETQVLDEFLLRLHSYLSAKAA
jgi:DNA polymerase-3 subunit delta